MPKMIGRDIPGSTEIAHSKTRGLVRLSYSQAKLLPASDVRRVLDTSDRGSSGSLAKRWWRWYASPEAITACDASTRRMRELVALQPLRPVALLFQQIARVAAQVAIEREKHPCTYLGRTVALIGVTLIARDTLPALCHEVARQAWCPDEDVLLDSLETQGIPRELGRASIFWLRRCHVAHAA